MAFAFIFEFARDVVERVDVFELQIEIEVVCETRDQVVVVLGVGVEVVADFLDCAADERGGCFWGVGSSDFPGEVFDFVAGDWGVDVVVVEAGDL